MVFNKSILILEDNLHVLSVLLEKLYKLESDQSNELSIMVLTNSDQVVTFINNNSNAYFDVIILDRDCKLNKSFHVLDIEKLGVDKVISISTVPEYNDAAIKRGVDKVVLKDLQNIDDFAEKVVTEVERIINPSRLQKYFNLVE